MDKYLTEEYRGAASRFLYGKKGDKVTVISIKDNMALVDLNGVKFFVRVTKLSDKIN